MSSPSFVVIVTIVVILPMFIQVSGHHLIVVNGDVAFDEVNEFLKDSVDIMPPSAVNSTRFYGNESEGDKYIDKYSDQIFQSEGDK